MFDHIQAILQQCGAHYTDKRTHIFDVVIAFLDENKLVLQGKVLEEKMRQELRRELEKQSPHLLIDDQAVEVLRKSAARFLYVSTNLTGLYVEPSFNAELSSELLNNWRLEVLFQRNKWGFVRQTDGYLGWAYLPYLTSAPVLPATHLVVAPQAILSAAPETSARPNGCVMGGTAVHVAEQDGEWAEVVAYQRGWMPHSALRAIHDLPTLPQARQTLIQQDYRALIGVPYRWGGCTANGIDCSGLAQLLHRWVGVEIPRDADMQCAAAKPVSPPFQPGDLLFFGEGGEKRKITHVAISLGGDEIVHSSRRLNGVYVDNYQKTESLRAIFVCAGNLLGR